MKSEWFTAKEVGEALGVSERAIQIKAKRESWLSRPRQGRGGGQEYHITSLPEDARIALARRDAAGPCCPLPGPGAEAGAAAGERLAVENAVRAETARIAREKGIREFNALPEDRKKEALAKLELLKARDLFMKRAKIGAIKRASELFAVEYQAGRISLPEWVTEYARRAGRLSVSWSSLNRWRKQHEDKGLIGLVNGFEDTKKDEPADPTKPWLSWESSVPGHMREFVVGVLTHHPHVKFTALMKALNARYHGQKKPHESAIRRFVLRWREENAEQLLYLSNPDGWKNQHMLALGSASEQIVALNQVWEMDSTPADIMLKDGRHTVVGCIDVFTRRFKLLVAPTSKSAHVAALARRCILDWGVPQQVKTDNGQDYVALYFATVLDQLEIEQVLCPPFTPECKPHIERAFRTFSHGIVELLPGYIGHNVVDRKAIESRKSFAARLMHKEETVDISLTAEEFQRLCDRWLNAMYHQDAHGSLGCTPAEKARAWTEPVRRILDERALDMLLMPAAQGGTREVTKKGIKVGGGWYISADLPSVGTTVRVLEDPADLGTVYLYEPEGKFLCAAQDPDRTGIDRAEIAAKAKAAQKRAMQEGAKILKKLAREAKADTIHEEILAHREAQIANVRELPRRSEEYTTAALQEAARAASEREAMRPAPATTVQVDREQLQREMADAAKVHEMPQDPKGRYRLACSYERQIAAGETLGTPAARWLERYQKGPEYRTFRSVEEELSVPERAAK